MIYLNMNSPSVMTLLWNPFRDPSLDIFFSSIDCDLKPKYAEMPEI